MSDSEPADPDKTDDKPSETGKKIRCSVLSLLKKMEMSNEEIKYRMENFDNVDIGKEYIKYLKCTKCNKNFQQVINRGEPVGIHPFLKVLMCNSCCDYYGDGNFSLDSEGEDKYCRWCGEGGTIFACSKCICGFCNVCIEKHFGVDDLEAVKNDDDWVCYFCNPKPLWHLRSICFLANEAAKSKREQLKKKENRHLKRKRRKKENVANESKQTSSDSSDGSSSSDKYYTKRKRLQLQKESVKRNESSCSEDEKENCISSKRKLVKSEKQSIDKKKSSESDVSVNAEFENTKSLVLEKFKSIWKLTRTITEVGLNSCRERLKNLSKPDNFKSLENLKREHEELKSCMNILMSSLNTVSNSVDSIKEDLTDESAKEEREIFQIQETKLKNFAKKYQEESNMESSVDSDQDSAQEELKVKKNKMPLTRGKKNSMRDSVKVEKKCDSDVSSAKNFRKGKIKSMYLFSDSGSDKEKKRNVESNIENKDKENRDSTKEIDLVKPLLKVKSFARMLDDNLYDKDKIVESKKENNPVVIDLYCRDTDESENENQKIIVSSDVKNDINARTSIMKENYSYEDNLELQKNFRIKKKEKSNSSSDESESMQFVCRKREDKLLPDDEYKTKSPLRIDERGSSYGSEEDKEKKYEEVKKKKEQIPIFDKSETSAGSSDDENERIKNCESREKKEGLDGDENEKNRLPVEGNCEEIELSKQENENEDCNNDKESEIENEKKKYSSNNKVKTVVEDESTEVVDCEKDRDSSTDKSKEKKELSENTKRVDVNEKELSESDGNLSEQGERISSTDETSRRRKEQDSSSSRTRKSSDEEQKSSRNSRKKKVKETLKASFEKYKRTRERFLSSKEKCQSESDRNEFKTTKALESSESESEQKGNDLNTEKPRLKRILASSDEENGKETTKIKSSGGENSEEESKNQKSDLQIKRPSSDGMTSDDETDHKIETKKIKRRKINVASSNSSEEETKKEKNKRKENSSESSGDEDKKKKKGRKNIKKILKKESLQVETKEALKNEEERKKRLKERQNLFEELFPEEKEERNSKHIILDFDPETKKPLVKVHKKLAKKLKPHQVKGVKFMWDNCFESVQKLEEESGSGCILAHCMGLGKTLQVITLVHTVMTHDLGVNTTLIVCPLSTVSNWVREFEMWLENVHTDPITLYDLVKYKKIDERRFHLEDWHQNGGVLVLSYDMFRTLTREVLTSKCKKRKAKYLQAFEKTLLDPGPDLVICDEGHLLKNEGTALSKLISRIKTSRRIVLTGTPLQNNLIEYHCMVQFVKPNILGTKKEFCNRFVNPINNGQFEDSTELDVKIMKRRSHVLHSMLDGCIQRFDYSVLTPFLPEKHEYVLLISLTETQAKAYLHFINNLSAKSSGNSRTASLFNDYNNLQRIWTHPRTMLAHYERESQKEYLESESEGSLKDFVVSSGEGTSESGSESSNASIKEVIPKKRILRSNANDPEVKKALEEEEKFQEKHWWDEFYDEKVYEDLQESNKLVVLFSLLKYCRQAKDKVLVFSQSLYSLDLIEYFLSRINENNKKNSERLLCGHQDTWILGSDYFRLDGCTRSESRAIWCKYFNQESNTRARLFLISTRAGGLGINLYGANRVVLFDASWNPSHDLQSIFRVYRFGQKKPCYIYRFLSEGTMEEKIYERQVTKLSLAHRVVDEHQIERHYSMGNLQELYAFEPTPKDQRKVPKLPKDSVLADLLGDHKDIIVGYHEHDSLLENKQEEELTEEERKAAWKEYEEEKAQKTYNFDAAAQQQMMLLQQMTHMQQSQFSQGGVGTQTMNPAYLSQNNAGQNFINPMFFQPNIPLDALQRGIRVGVTPLPNESLESYFMRIFNRENWMLTK